MQLLANASSLLTSHDLALPPNDPRVFLPTPFAPGQSARTLLEQELRRKREQENKEWLALQSTTPVSTSAQPAVTAQTQTQMLLQNPHRLMQQQLQFGRGQYSAGVPLVRHQPFVQQQLQLQTLLHQQPPHLLTLEQKLAAEGLLSPTQVNLYAPNPAPLAFQQPIPSTRNEVPISSVLGVGLPQLSTYGGSSHNTLMSNYMPGLIHSVPIAASVPITNNNVASTHALDSSAGGLNWLLQQPNSNERSTMPPTPAQPQNHQKVKGPEEQPAALKTAFKRSGKVKSSEKSRPGRWAQRYKELLEFKRVEGHCRVPHGYPPNKKLAWWVMNQRAQYAQRSNGKSTWLTEERIKLLEDVGFVWCPNAKKSRKK